MAKKQARKKKTAVHKSLEGFDIHINEFGEIVSNLNIERLNEFLNENVEDKKLKEPATAQEKTEGQRPMKKNVAIFASGAGSNARKIIGHFKHHPGIRVSLVVSNNPEAGVLDIARDHGIPTLLITRQEFKEGGALSEQLTRHRIDFIALAGFLWLIPAWLVRQYDRRMVNIHPSLLPKHGGKGMYGMHVHEAVCRAGESETGITIHFVNEHYDDGDVVFQARCRLEPGDSPQAVAKKVLELEHRHFPEIIEQLLTDNIS